MIARWGEMWLPAIVSEKDCLINEKCKECVIWQVAEVDRSFLQNFRKNPQKNIDKFEWEGV